MKQEQQDMMLESRRMRPNRSDTHVSMEEELEIEGKTRDYFDALAPKRASKPHRSDVSNSSSSSSSDHHTSNTTTTNPEFIKFQQLQQKDDDHSQKKEEVAEEEEEYTETEYYKDLNCIDKQHHTTGTGFITVVAEENSSSGYINCSSPQQLHSSCKGNPATNDWIPSDQVMIASSSNDDKDALLESHHKPNRSEN